MRMEIDFKKIKEVYNNNKEHEFHWKANGEYKKGNHKTLIDDLYNHKVNVSEVIGFMKDRDKTNEMQKRIGEELSAKKDLMFEIFANINFDKLTTIHNQHGPNFHETCNEKITEDISKKSYNSVEMQKIVREFFEEALDRYISSYEAWVLDDCTSEYAPEGEYFNGGIFIKFDTSGIEFSYQPISMYFDDVDKIIND